jgi:hypothetical protein
MGFDRFEQGRTIELAHVVPADGNAGGTREDAADEALEHKHLVHCGEARLHTGHIADYGPRAVNRSGSGEGGIRTRSLIYINSL